MEQQDKKAKVRSSTATIVDPLLTPYVIEIDGDNYSVVRDTGSVHYRPNQGHFRSLGAAIDRIAKLKTVDANNGLSVTLKEYVETFKAISESLKVIG